MCTFWEDNGMEVNVVADCEELVCPCCNHCCDADGCGPSDGMYRFPLQVAQANNGNVYLVDFFYLFF